MRPIATLTVLAALTAAAAAPGAAAPRPLSAGDRSAIGALVDRFVLDAVERHDSARAYDDASASLREGMTRAEWATGNIPVYPYQARGRHFPWTLDYVDGPKTSIELVLQPSRRTAGAITFDLVLVRHGSRWLVDSIQPVAAFAPQGATARVSAQPDFQPGGAVADSSSSRLTIAWLAIPAALVLLGLCVPVVVVTRNRRRTRRIARELGSSTTMPPLPNR